MIRSLDLEELPLFSAAGIDAARSAAARLQGIDRHPVQVQVPRFGTASLTLLDVTPPDTPHDNDAIWVLARTDGDRRTGYLILDGLSALRLIAMTLGLPAPRMPRPLGAAERGIVAGTIATMVHGTAHDVVVALAPKPWRPDGLARLVIHADFGGLCERIRLDVPPEWIPSTATTALVTNATRRGLEITLPVQLARTMLTVGDWARARVGDAIVFDETAVVSDQEWPAQILIGEFVAPVLLGSDGCARVLGHFQTDRNAMAAPTNTQDLGRNGRQIMSSDQEASSVTVLAAAPIQVVAEIGRLVLRADEVVALRPGSILTLGGLRPTTVELRVGDRSWGYGELVNVDGQLGVRLTTLESQPAAPADSAEARTVR